jgi:hypothetical protein
MAGIDELRALAAGPGTPAELRRAVKSYAEALSAPPSLTELDALYRSGGRGAQRAALELALLQRAAWGKRWGGLFLRWARTPESGDVADRLGAELLGPLWLAGEIEARQLVSLSLFSETGPWRSGLAALWPSLARDDRDFPLFEQFAKACVSDGAPFHESPDAWRALAKALRRALKGAPAAARSWAERHEPSLPGGLTLQEDE